MLDAIVAFAKQFSVQSKYFLTSLLSSDDEQLLRYKSRLVVGHKSERIMSLTDDDKSFRSNEEKERRQARE